MVSSVGLANKSSSREDRARAERWAAAERILCVRLDTVGDVLMTTPAMRALKQSGRDRHVTLLTSSAGAETGRLVPDCDEVMVYDSPWMKATSTRTGSAPEYRMAERLRAQEFDATVIFTVYSQNPLPAAFLCYLAGIPLRLAHCRENPYQLLTDWVRDTEPDSGVRHEVRRQLDLVGKVGCRIEDERLGVRVTDDALERVDGLLQELGLDASCPWMVLHPGASAPSRRYPPEKFAEAAGRLVREHGLQVVLTGTEPECALVMGIQGMMNAPSVSLAGRLSLAELAALLSRAPLLISNNTGPAHVAAAVGTPVVDLYALTNPQHTPWQVPSRILFHDVPCRYCLKSICPEGHHACLRRVEVDEVVRAALELLGLEPQEDDERTLPRFTAGSSEPAAAPHAVGSEPWR